MNSKKIFPDKKRKRFDKINLESKKPSDIILLYRALLAAEEEILMLTGQSITSPNTLKNLNDKWKFVTTERFCDKLPDGRTRFKEVNHWTKGLTDKKETFREYISLNNKNLPDWCKNILNKL